MDFTIMSSKPNSKTILFEIWNLPNFKFGIWKLWRAQSDLLEYVTVADHGVVQLTFGEDVNDDDDN